MQTNPTKLWRGLSSAGQGAMQTRDYREGTLAEQLATTGLDAGRLAGADRAGLEEAWIPGVEIFPRAIYPQRHRGSFGELVRRDEGVLKKIGLWPQQWSAARMFAQTAKGFHIHPPSVPAEMKPEDWFRRLFVEEPENFAVRPYAEEQWDVMFFLQGQAEVILREERAGLPVRTMRLWIAGDDHRGSHNVGLVIPAGVAHAIRVEGSADLVMVYGTTVSFRPEFEGRIASEVETATLPETWQRFLAL